jgi:hypothetical protein
VASQVVTRPHLRGLVLSLTPLCLPCLRSDDVECYCNTLVSWSSVSKRFTALLPWLPYVGPGRSKGFSDLDSIDVGQVSIAAISIQCINYPCVCRQGDLDGLTNDEKQSYATLWAIAAGKPIIKKHN